MTDFQITNGVVEYSRTIRPADFESKVSRATLSFNIAEGSDPAVVLAKVSAIAKEQVHAELGLPHNRGLAPESRPQVVAPPADTGEKRTRGLNKTKEPEKQPEVVEANPLEALAGAAQAGEPASGAEAVSESIDDLAQFAGPVEQPATTADVQAVLMKASAHLRKEFGNTNDILKLLAKYSVPGYMSLTAEQRGPFIKDAEALATMKKG